MFANKKEIFSAALNKERASKDKYVNAIIVCDILLNLSGNDHSIEGDEYDTAFEMAMNEKPLEELIESVSDFADKYEDISKFSDVEKSFILKSRVILCKYIGSKIGLNSYRKLLFLLVGTMYEGLISIDEADKQFLSLINKFKVSKNHTIRGMEFIFTTITTLKNDYIRPSVGRYFREITVACKKIILFYYIYLFIYLYFICLFYFILFIF